MEQLLRYYADYDEEGRLERDPSHRLEFLSTIRALERFREPSGRILETGAGSGIYSLYYGRLGHEVLALDIVPKHVERINERIQDLGLSQVSCRWGDARCLDSVPDESYDMVLCLGPLYHLHDEAERKRCVEESYRVLRKGGILASAVIHYNAVYVRQVMRNPAYLIETNFGDFIGFRSEAGMDRELFFFCHPNEVESVMEECGFSKLDYVGTDGIGSLLNSSVNGFTPEQYEAWLDYHYSTMSDPVLLGYSLHGLYIGRK